jgi:hypothetical protein
MGSGFSFSNHLEHIQQRKAFGPFKIGQKAQKSANSETAFSKPWNYAHERLKPEFSRRRLSRRLLLYWPS